MGPYMSRAPIRDSRAIRRALLGSVVPNQGSDGNPSEPDMAQRDPTSPDGSLDWLVAQSACAAIVLDLAHTVDKPSGFLKHYGILPQAFLTWQVLTNVACLPKPTPPVVTGANKKTFPGGAPPP